MSYLLAFLGFAALITLHEAGHFVAAKAVGMRVERFSLFFGPMLLKRRIGETDYGVGVIPLGGYVKITGMSPNEEFDSPEVESRAYINQPPWKRIVVIAAGPAVNLALAFLLVWIAFINVGGHNIVRDGAYVSTTTVGQVVHGTAAAGVLRVNDTLVSVDGVAGTGDPAVLHDQIVKHVCAGGERVNGCVATTPARIVVRRHGVLKTLELRPRWSAKYHEMQIGVSYNPKVFPNSVVYSAGQSVTGLWHVTKASVTAIVELFKPKERKQLHSVIGGYKYVQEGISQGLTSGLDIIGLISLALGIINLFPFLPLDGGHIFWALVEQIRGRRVPWVVIERATFVGIGLVLILMFIGISNDISHIANHTLGKS